MVFQRVQLPGYRAKPVSGCCTLLLAITTAPAQAATPASFVATADEPMRFGTLVSAGGGSRTVGTDGSTSSDGVLPLGDKTSSPAQFTMTYARASGDHTSYQLIFQFTLPRPATAVAGGAQGTLSDFTTDLPGVQRLQPGVPATYSLPNCVAATCSVTFHVGATLTVTPAQSGGSLTFPLILLTTVTTALG